MKEGQDHFEGPEPGTVIQYFKDDATSGKDGKHDIIAGKGVLNNRISAHIYDQTRGHGNSDPFLKCLNMREQLIRQVGNYSTEGC